jgi:hypothetical protein
LALWIPIHNSVDDKSTQLSEIPNTYILLISGEISDPVDQEVNGVLDSNPSYLSKIQEKVQYCNIGLIPV